MSANTLYDSTGPTTITLPDDLQWTDEYDWSPVSQQVEPSFDGSLIIEESALQAGRPITLEGAQDYAWMDRVTLESLRVLSYAARSTPMVLTLFDGRTFNVLFRHTAPPAVSGKPLVPLVPAADGDFYAPLLKFVQV